MPRSQPRRRLALSLPILMLAAALGPAGASTPEIALEPLAYPALPGIEPAGGWIAGAFHVAHGIFGDRHYAYDPRDDAWTALPSPPLRRSSASSATLDGFWYVAGGTRFDCQVVNGERPCAILERYDPTFRTWERMPDMREARIDAGVAALGGKLYVVGGKGNGTASVSVEVFDPATRTWSDAAPLPQPRLEATALLAHEGRLYLLGGKDVLGDATPTVLVYTPLLNSWTSLPPAPLAFRDAVVGTCDGKILVWGGSETPPGQAPRPMFYLRIYDPLLQQWTQSLDYLSVSTPARGGSLTAGDMTVTMKVGQAHAFRCPAGGRPWDTLPDVLVEGVDLDVESPEHGDVVTLSAVVRNRGTTNVPGGRVEFRFGAGTLGNGTYPALAPGASATVAGPAWTAVGGDRVLSAVADADRALAEGNEDNNRRDATFHVRIADLVVSKLTLVPSIAGEGQSVRLAATVRNVGDAGAAATNVTFFRSFTPVSIGTPMPALAAGEEAVVLGNAFSMPSGTTTMRASVDLFRTVPELNDLNNQGSTVVTAARPDLRATALAAEPDALRHGDATTLTATIVNEDLLVAGAFLVRFALDGATLAEVPLAGLAGGETAQVSAAWTAVEGTHGVSVTVDALGQVAESEEADNVAHFPLAVAPPPRPDLVVDALATDPSTPRPGNKVLTTATVRNAGNAPSLATTVQFTRDGADLGAATLPALAPGETATVAATARWLAIPGTFTLRAVADPGGSVLEGDESNNARERSVAVEPTL